MGVTGLLWLLLSYGYVLYEASGLISEGSELLLLIPKFAGLVGSVVLPLLGAVPDGAIILFSGLGSLETAQETLSVGVGALAGSTIMLLTIPFCLSVAGGRVNLGLDGKPNYLGKPKLSPQSTFRGELKETGVTLTAAVQKGGIIMIITTAPYLLIQGPAWYHYFFVAPADPDTNLATLEHSWALAGLIVCAIGLVWYLHLQVKLSEEHQDHNKRMAVLKKQLQKGAVSLSGAVAAEVKQQEMIDQAGTGGGSYQAVDTTGDGHVPSPEVKKLLTSLLADSFHSYDTDKNGNLDRNEVYVFFRDFNESITEAEMHKLFTQVDTDGSGDVNLEEFIGIAYMLIKAQDEKEKQDGARPTPKQGDPNDGLRKSMAETAFNESEEEEETVPEEFTSLPPDKQQAAIQQKAFLMLAAGTVLVVLFSDPMVDVLSAIATRANLPPFYVSFILAPLASNASEILASQYYASKKTRKTITVSLTTLEGAASINNTFCLAIFMGLIYFRGLTWSYSAETLAILLTQIVVGFLVQRPKMTMGGGLFLCSIFPLSIALVAALEALGFD